ncbi:transposase, partial [Klebsiella pneumoniae]
MKDQITYLPDNADRSVAKQKFKITNWPTYNKALINRGSITFWLDDEAIQAWYESATPSSRGRPQRYSDLAITTVLGTVAKLAMRQPFVLFKGLTFQKLCL